MTNRLMNYWKKTSSNIETLDLMSDEELDARQSAIMDEALNIMNERGYIRTTKEEFNRINPYLIDRNEFATIDEYEALSLTYFADGVLTDEEYEVIKNPKELVGDFEQYFKNGTSEIFVRCDERCADYEIAKDIRTYAEFYNTIPHMKWRQDE